MEILLGALILVLLVIVIVQIGKVTELANKIRGEEDAQKDSDYWNSRLGVAFMVVFLLATIVSALYYKNYMLGFGPHESASEHGSSVDLMFSITLFFTGIVFVITHIALFWFAYKYRYNENRKAIFNPHDNRLEIIWTIIPAIVMAILVIYGLDAWNKVMSDVGPDDDYIEMEVTGMQFAWLIRYPGEDGELGKRDYRRISGTNPLGQIWTDENNLDDFQPSEIVLPVDKKVRVRITSRDVLHNFDLPHFRVKMDAVPGMPTYFVFKPTKTTKEYRKELSKYKEYQRPFDPDDPEGPEKWELFDYELACAELCGNGHFSMRKVVKIVSQEEYDQWLSEQESFYYSAIRNTDDDPYKGTVIENDVDEAIELLMEDLTLVGSMNQEMLNAMDEADKTFTFDATSLFPEGSDELPEVSKEGLVPVINAMNGKKGVLLKIDITGENKQLNYKRAVAIANYLNIEGINNTNLEILPESEPEEEEEPASI